MFNKVPTYGLALGFLAASLFLPSAGQAATLVQNTPYDTRLSESGLFSPQPAVQKSAGMEQLFNQARAFRYIKDDRRMDRWQSPEETESRWAGDCEDKAVWLFKRLQSSGLEGVRLVIGRKDASSSGFHVWVTVENMDGCTYVLDPSAQKRIWKCADFSSNSYKPLYSFDGQNRYRHEL